MALYVYRPPAFIDGLVRRKQAQHRNMLIILATTYTVALLIGAYAIFAPTDKTGSFYSAFGNVTDFSSLSQAGRALPDAGDLANRKSGRTINSINLLRTNPSIVRDGWTAPKQVEVAVPDAGVFGWANEADLIPGDPNGSGLVFASESYDSEAAVASCDTSLPKPAMWEWTERSARIIKPPDTTPAYMKPTTRLRHPRKAAGINGWVALRFKIGKNGVFDLEILAEDPPGYGFGATVRSYLENCYVWPAITGGKPIVTEVQAAIRMCPTCRPEAKTSGNLVFHEP